MRNDSKPIANSAAVSITMYEPSAIARIEGDLLPLRHDIASIWCKFQIGAGGQAVPALTHRAFFRRCGLTGRTFVPSALVPTIISRLRAEGIEPQIKQVGDLPSHFGANPTVIAGLQPPWDSFATTIDSNPDGVIEVGGTRELEMALVTICRIYPDQTILILAASQDACHWLRWRLQAAIGEPIELRIKSQPARHRIVISPYRHPLSPREFSMVIVAFGHELAGETVYEALLYIFSEVRRRFAFVHTLPRLGWHERDTAQALFGRTIWTSKVQATTPVGVYYCDAFAPAPAPPSYERGLQRKQSQIWHNAARNQSIATAAMATLNRDISQLWELGLLLEYKQFPEIAELADWRVVVVVEGTEHAEELHKRLPDWPVLRAGSDCLAGNGAGAGSGMIVTLTRAVEAGMDCSVLVWAAGGAARPVAGFPSQGASMGIVVDFAVAGEKHEELRRRVLNYLKLDWEVDQRLLRAAERPQTKQSRVDGASDHESHPNQQRHVDARSTGGRSLTSGNKSHRKRDAAKHQKRAVTHVKHKTGRKDNRHKLKRTGNHSGTRAHLRRSKRT